MLVFKWSLSEDYTHAYFVVPVIVYMIWEERDILNRYSSSVWGLMLVLLSIGAYIISLQIRVPAVMILTTIGFAISCLIYIGGIHILKDLFIPILLLIFIIPIPLQILTILTGKLQLLVSDISTNIIHLLSIPLYQEGNVLHLAEESFQVVHACSSIRSLISMTTLSLILGYYTLTRKRLMAILFIFSIPVAIVVNLIRISSMVIVFHYFKIDLTHGNPHTFAGILLFVIGLLFLVAFQRMLKRWEK